ncbi:FAD:protein FMN transferase [Oxalicibacterium faecigallinarum]|uniref:FAD:protein FMN transferase n=1 Tax=Oxalicibacterium faecigallinarum TaxID=573741 RepID=A0A8J3ARC7_9BURK|nr:FAD:protein FMN transferase [Oxalicibacterium faecigallinarum]GGI19298.1 FAD:protein FMN transferase [Oxalicibacterium faecigallinarum]
MRHTYVPILDVPPEPPVLGTVVQALQGNTMGTSWSVKLVTRASRKLTDVQQAIQQQLDLVIAQMSTWEAGSNLSRYNNAPAGSWHELPDAFFRVLDCALQVARESDGAYDPSAGLLVNLWGFGPENRYDQPGFVSPDQITLNDARTLCGWQRVTLDRAQRRVQQPGGLFLDFSAIAKGFAVDLVAQAIESLGFENFLVEIGGELRGHGIRPDGQPWWVVIEQPPHQHGTTDEHLIALYRCTMATSGDYRRFFTRGTTRYAHTINPRTGEPLVHALASVTVVHRECMLADAWSTALGVMGAEEGLACANRLGLAALFLTRDEDVLHEQSSLAMKAMLQ